MKRLEPFRTRQLLTAALVVLACHSVAASAQESACLLSDAAKDGRLSDVLDLIRHGADINGVDCTSSPHLTPLWFAVYSNNVGMVKLLLSEGVQPSIAGRDLLESPAALGRLELARTLLAYGADPNERSRLSGGTPLHTAAALCGIFLGRPSDCVQTVELLLEKGARPNEPDVRGDGPLHEAAQHGNAAVIQALVCGGADINGKNPYGQPPLAMALYSYAGSVAYVHSTRKKQLPPGTRYPIAAIAVLLELGADPNFFQPWDYGSQESRRESPVTAGNTYLTVAARYGWYEFAALLLKAGADPTRAREDGQTPHSIASANGHIALARLVARYASWRAVPNPSFERTCPGKPSSAAQLQR